MPYANPDAIVNSQWLAHHLTAPDVRVVDASWFMPASGRVGRAEYERQHIPGAVYFDINDIADSASSLPHMLPDAAKFASRVRKLGLDNGSRVIVYDRAGSAAARAWWMFRVFGHNDVALLDGGLGKLLREGRPVDDLPPMPRERHFMPRVNQLLVRNKDQMKANVESRREQVVDARSRGRFAGSEPEPWPHKKVGHIPGSGNVPWGELLDSRDGTFLPSEALAERFATAGIDPARPAVATCGSGVSACVLVFGLYLLGNREAAVYDGSWAEWGLADDTPAVTG
jgi:thiosulfate/3-mercaptopyruvate sulfurtransferase